MSDADYFTDGLWHSFKIEIVPGVTNGRVSVTVDGRPDVSNRQLDFKTSPTFLIGGLKLMIINLSVVRI